MRQIISSPDSAASGAVRLPSQRQASPPGRLLLPVVTLLSVLLTACGGAEYAVSQPPPVDDSTTPAAGELSAVAQSGVTAGDTLQGLLWVDSDGDGKFGLGDWVLAGASVVLEIPSGESLTVTTDPAGQYRFTGLTPESPFRLRHRLPSGPALLTPQAGQFATATPETATEQIVKHYLWQ